MNGLAAVLLGAVVLAPAASRAAPQDTLVVCDDVADPPTLDPQKQFGEKSYNVVQQVFEGLVRFGPRGQILPALAERWERVDDRTIRFHLRGGVVFHDGEPFDAAAVKFSIARYLDPATGFPGAGYIASLDRADVVDGRTVDVVTKVPDGLLLNRLASLVLMVAPRYYSTQPPETLKAKPVGTGPFRFKSWSHGQSIELEANPRYWEPGVPKVRRLVFRFLSPERQVDELLTGAVDLVTDVPGTQTTRVQASRAARVIKSPVLYTISASFNLAAAPLSDVRVRQALNYAVNKADLIRYDLMGNGLPETGIVLQGHPGAGAVDGPEPYPYDPAKARELLARAGVRPGLKLRILDIKATRAAKIIAASWRRLGIRTEVHSTTDARMIEDMRRKPAWDLMIGSCPDPMYHPYFIPFIFLYSKSPFSLTHSTDVDALFDAVVAATDPAEQERRVAALDEAVTHQALTLFTYQRIRTYGLRKGLRFEPSLSGMPYFRDAGFEP